MARKIFTGGFALFLATFLATSASAADVSLVTLLDEMVDRNAITQFPDPAFTCKQASSYDRRSISPNEKGWYANGDTSQFVREEMNGDRKEWVLMDEKGPGAIVRWWITAPHYKSNLRIYIDGKKDPEITANVGDLVGGKFLVDAPLNAPRAKGRNLYLPIPYEKSIKITVDDMPTQKNLYYQINYRTYENANLNVESFSMKTLRSLRTKIDQVQEKLLATPVDKDVLEFDETFLLLPNGGMAEILERTETPVTINSVAMKVEADDLPQALRSTLVRVSFDGIETIRVPLGDFFGGGVGINPYKTWYTQVEENGTLHSFWKMPFKEKIEVTFINYDPNQNVRVIVGKVGVEPIQWTDRTMYFFADWRQDRQVQTYREEEKKQDWNYIALEGKGVFVGDSLSVCNAVPDWWGEGDEKIYVDDETFPSHFGTGTEDYYGYAWCTPEFFEAPFHAQPRAEGPGNFGHTTNDRFRLLDQIPFDKKFRFDMEIWHWAETTVDYSVVSYWYGFPGIKSVGVSTGKPLSDERFLEEIKSKVVYKTPFVFKMSGFELHETPTGGNLTRQIMSGWKDGKWKDDDQLWWTGTKPGDKLELKVNLEKSGPQKLICEMTKARDYGKFQFYFDGQKLGNVVDLYNPEKVINSGPVEIGTVTAEKGEHVLTIEVVGKNEKSVGTMFGLDVYRFE